MQDMDLKLGLKVIYTTEKAGPHHHLEPMNGSPNSLENKGQCRYRDDHTQIYKR